MVLLNMACQLVGLVCFVCLGLCAFGITDVETPDLIWLAVLIILLLRVRQS